MAAVGGSGENPAPRGSHRKGISQEKLDRVLKRRKKLLMKQKELAEREVNFDNEAQEEELYREEKEVSSLLLQIEKKLYRWNQLENITDDGYQLFEKDQKARLNITETGNELLNQRLSEELKKNMDSEPDFIVSCALDADTLANICNSVREEQLAATGKSSIPKANTAARDELINTIARIIKKTVIQYRYGDHKNFLNLFITEDESEQLASQNIEEAHGPVDMQMALHNMITQSEEETKEADDQKEIIDLTTTDDKEGTDYDDVWEDDDEEEEKDEIKPFNKVTNKSKSELREFVNGAFSALMDGINGDKSLPAEPKETLDIKEEVKGFCLILILNFNILGSSSRNVDSPDTPVTPPVGAHNNSQQLKIVPETDESCDADEQLKPKWLTGNTSNEFAESYNAHLAKDDEVKIVFSTVETEYEEIPNIEDKQKMERCAKWVANIECHAMELISLDNDDSGEEMKTEQVRKRPPSTSEVPAPKRPWVSTPREASPEIITLD